jgi:hypothetical protein
METRLVQTQLFRERTYELRLEQIRVVDRTPLASQAYDVRYDVLFGNRIDHVTTSRQALVLVGASAFFTILSLIALIADFKIPEKRSEAIIGLVTFGLACALCSIYWLFSRRQQIQFINGELSLYIRRDHPSVEAVDAFIEQARARARERMRSRLLPLQHSGDPRRDRRYAYMLRDKDIITAEECTEFLEATQSPYRDPGVHD